MASSVDPADVAATFCATLVDEWVRGGVTDAVVCPGSRSTPMALALTAEPRLRIHVHQDERSAGFLALGLGLAAGRPAVVLTTSGTAAVELHPAIVEAHQARVPLIAVTADRPPELQDVGAPQTIDQTHLYGRSVRWFSAPGVPDDASRQSWRAIGARTVIEANGAVPGPVHVNLAFREPLVGVAGPPPAGRDHGRPWHRTHGPRPAAFDVGDLAARTVRARGVIVAGAGITAPSQVHRLARALGWPVLADPRSGARTPDVSTIAAADAILRHHATAAALTPDVVLRLGEPPASRIVGAWLAGSDAHEVLVHGTGRHIDPDHRLADLITADPGTVCAALADALPSDTRQPHGWLDAWTSAERTAQTATERILAAHAEPTEPAVARTIYACLPDDAALVVASSMPIRDLEWYGAPRCGVRVLANRGANGIDGVVSTAVGVAAAHDGPTVALVGDLAFLHDTNGLLGLTRRDLDLTVVVIDNDGGGIFSFLPQRDQVPPDRFEQVFGTPHGIDLAALASAHGLAVASPSTAAEVGPAVASAVANGGASVVIVRTDRDANVAVHAEVHAAVAHALER